IGDIGNIGGIGNTSGISNTGSTGDTGVVLQANCSTSDTGGVCDTDTGGVVDPGSTGDTGNATGASDFCHYVVQSRSSLIKL
ncbi:36809_t:CDS:2, partial [Gigaspora margarita]